MARRVKNVLRPHEVEPEFDPRGKVFFPVPELIVVEHPKAASNNDEAVTIARRMQQQGDPNPVLDIVNALEGPVRTKSCNWTGAFNKPSHVPDKVRYAISQRPSLADVNEYLARNDIHGYGVGTIVARRWAYHWRFLYCHQWGLIKACSHAPRKGEDWAPYDVMWFDSSTTEPCWAEDLLVIHANMTPELLISIAEEQGMDVTLAQEHVEKSRRKDAV